MRDTRDDESPASCSIQMALTEFGGAGGIIMILPKDHFEPSITGVLAVRFRGPETGFKARSSLS